MDYDDAKHEYSDNGVIIPSVTQIIYGFAPKPWLSKESSDRGHEAHRLCADYARDPTGFPTEPYVDAFALWCFKHNPKWVAIETLIDGHVDGYRYAGRFDGLATIGDCLVLIDWKTGVKSVKFIAQLGGYALVTKPKKTLILYLRDDMTYEEHWLSPSELVLGIQYFRVAIREYYAQTN